MQHFFRIHNKWVRLLPMLAGLMLLSPAAHATGALDTIQNVYQTAMHGWFSTLQGIANDLFFSLAAIDITWMALTWMLTRKTFDEIVPSVLKKVMTLGFFLALLTNAGTWVPDVIDSFVDAGQQAGAYQTLTPSTIMMDAVGASVGILTGTTPAAAGSTAPAQQSVFQKVLSTVESAASPLGDIEDVLLRIIVAFVVFAALTYIAIELLVLLIESYVVIGAGVLFLGFGGSRWTTKFVDGYLNYMVSLGTKLFVLYLIVGALVFQVLPAINTMLSSLTTGFSPSTGLEAMGATAVMAMLAKTLPHHAGALLSGASSLSGGHGVDAVKSVGKAAVAVGAVAAAPAVLAAGAAGAAGGGAATAGGAAAGATGAAGGGVAASSASAGVAAPSASGAAGGASSAGSSSGGGQTSSSPTTTTKAPDGSRPSVTTADSGGGGSTGRSTGTPGGEQQPVPSANPEPGPAGTQQDARTTAGNSGAGTGSGSNGGGNKGSKGVSAPSRVATLKKVGGHFGNALDHGVSSGGGPSVNASHIGTKHLDD
ncbi:P-type conjugative transfer protein TrbL [Acidithiobacillus ferrooxidans]|uniref:P-type conjugative transfer protein TrbL n=1 Tax=Acidithiobacillus ferrooxidans TaxID=920 RepID=UPI000ABAAE34|nr:P-type conjugative transfer protein TrbL [Acidithiobacillus ferrooxidans]